MLGFRGVSRDVTMRKKAEEALRESEERLALVLEATKDGIWDWDPIGKMGYVSKRFKELTGLKGDISEHEPDDWYLCIHPDHRDKVKHTMDRHMEGKGDYDVDYLYRRKNEKQYHWHNVQGMAIFDEK